jgi:diacylglycerol kinase (ATP)
MKFVKLLHNPGAGDGGHSIDELAGEIEAAGFKCESGSIKNIKEEPVLHTSAIDFVALAGGDGTIRKAAKVLIEENVPIGLFPVGTANNIARTLSITDDPKEVIQTWKKGKVKAFDIGNVEGLEEPTFFLEGIGYGVFPVLMDAMSKQAKTSVNDPEAKLQTAVEILYDIVKLASATQCTIQVDGKKYSGNYLLVEVMNTKSIGPNLFLAPSADPGDGQFEVVLISEEQREQFLDYLAHKAEGNEKETYFKILRGQDIRIEWKGTTLHVDDEKIDTGRPQPINISLQHAAFNFLVP